MKYQITKGTNNPDVAARTNGSFFSDNMEWEDFYFDMLLPEGNLYKCIDWLCVKVFITEGIHKCVGGHRNSDTVKIFRNITSSSTSIPNTSSSVRHVINTTTSNKKTERFGSDEYGEEENSGEEDEYREECQSMSDLHLHNNINQYEVDNQFMEDYAYQ